MYLWLLAGTGWGGKGTSFPRRAGGCACQNVPTQRNVHWLCLTPHGCELTWAFASTPILSPLWKFGPQSLIHHCSAYKCTKCWECFGFFLNYNCNWLFPFSLVYFFSQRCLALHCDCMPRPDVSFMTMSHGLLLWFLPRPQIHHMLPWLHKTNQTNKIYIRSTLLYVASMVPFRKCPWCTVLRPPLCLQQQLLPPASPSLQQLPPIRFGPFNGFLSRVQILRTGRGLDPVRGRSRRGSVCVCASVRPGMERGRSRRLPGRSVGMGDRQGRGLSSKTTPPPAPQNTTGRESAELESRKTCSASAFSLKQKYQPEHPSLWYFGLFSLDWKVEVEI